MDEKIIFKEESYKIIGICMNIHSTLGNGFLEAVYSEVLEKEFVKKGSSFVDQNESIYRPMTLLHPLQFYFQKEQALKRK